MSTLSTHPTAAESGSPILSADNIEFFRQNGYVVLDDFISQDELAQYLAWFDHDRSECCYRWYCFGHHQYINCDALVTSPRFDSLVRHPKIFRAVEQLMAGPICFGEISLRHMRAYEGEAHQKWHRDRPHWLEHPLRADYIQSLVYLEGVDETTHCFTISPESIEDPILAEHQAQLTRSSPVDIVGRAGTVCLFNVAVLHTATTRPTNVERKTVQTYYGHRGRKFLANDSVIPANLWKYHEDPEVRAFYGNLNDVSRLFGDAFGVEP